MQLRMHGNDGNNECVQINLVTFKKLEHNILMVLKIVQAHREKS